MNDAVNPLDSFLASSFEDRIKQKFGSKVYLKINKRLAQRFDMKVHDSIADFNKIDSVLREFFGAGADDIEKEFCQSIINHSRRIKSNSSFDIEDSKLSNIILTSYGNVHKRKIIEHLTVTPNIITKTLNSCKIPKSSGYKIFSELINDGLVYGSDFELTHDKKKVNRYSPLFDEISVHLKDGLLKVSTHVTSEIAKQSNLSQLV